MGAAPRGKPKIRFRSLNKCRGDNPEAPARLMRDIPVAPCCCAVSASSRISAEERRPLAHSFFQILHMWTSGRLIPRRCWIVRVLMSLSKPPNAGVEQGRDQRRRPLVHWVERPSPTKCPPTVVSVKTSALTPRRKQTHTDKARYETKSWLKITMAQTTDRTKAASKN